MRSAMTMSPDRGGIFDTLLGSCAAGSAAPAATAGNSSRGFTSATSCGLSTGSIARDDFAGPVNLAAPEPLPNAEFMQATCVWLGNACRSSRGAVDARIGAVLLRTETELILKSRRVVPRRLLDAGFAFEFPAWPVAAAELCAGRRGLHAS